MLNKILISSKAGPNISILKLIDRYIGVLKENLARS
jgi:hypothetical protein